MQILKVSNVSRIKWKDCQMDPVGSAFAKSLRGIKHFQDFNKAWKVRILKLSKPFREHNKIVRLSNGPHSRSAFAGPFGG